MLMSCFIYFHLRLVASKRDLTNVIKSFCILFALCYYFVLLQAAGAASASAAAAAAVRL